MTHVLSSLKLPFTHLPALTNVLYVHVGSPRVGAFHRGSAVEGPEGFPQGGSVYPSRVIKMEVCLNKDTLGHFFPT